MQSRLDERILSFFFPLLCPGCQKIIHTQGFCSSCWQKLDFLTDPLCALCGKPSIHDYFLCLSCKAFVPFFDYHRSLWRYGPLSRKVIFALKHGRHRFLAQVIAPWLVPFLTDRPVDALIPVPLHPQRLASRGFNQSALVASSLSSLTGIPLLIEGLARRWMTPPQAGLSFHQRQENIQGAFYTPSPLKASHIALIDDVYTTGATLNGCAFALKEAGVETVYAFTLAQVF